MVHPDSGILFSAKRSQLSSHEKDTEDKCLFRFFLPISFDWVVCLFAIELHKLFGRLILRRLLCLQILSPILKVVFPFHLCFLCYVKTFKFN